MRGLGAIPDKLDQAEHDNRTRSARTLVGSSNFAPYKDWSHIIDRVINQGSTNSCVGQWFSNAIYLAGQASGLNLKRTSAHWSYSIARYLATPGYLEDFGCRPYDCIRGAVKHGLVNEEDYPFMPDFINKEPPFDLDIKASETVFTGYYRASGIEEMKAGLEKGHFPGFSMQVYENFMDWQDGVYDEPEGELIGRHMVTLIGYRPGSFRLLNSWGKNWGESGLAWISERFVQSHYVADRYIITAGTP